MALESEVPLENAASRAVAGEAPKKRAPTLYAIIGFKLLKGAIFLSVAIAIYCLSDDDLPAELHSLLHWLRIPPDTKFWSDLAVKVGNLTEGGMIRVAIGFFIYSLFSWVEGVGLIFRVSWAGWLAIGESAFFVPLEILELLHKFSWFLTGVMVINVVIVWYLIQNRQRLFRHHHH